MEEKTFTITLSDGTQITDLGLSGNNFISDNELKPEDFEGKLKSVTVTCSDENFHDRWGIVGEHKNMTLEYLEESVIPGYEGKYLFILSEPTTAEIKEMTVNARLDFLEMMTL